MDIHGENSFKSKTYSIIAFTIEKLPTQLADLPREKIFQIKGIGDSIGKKVIEILETGHLKSLEDYVQKTPAGVLEMLGIKGLGPKKISIIWKEMGIESIGELQYACTENRLANYKGFGAKTQQGIEEAISFYLNSQGSHLYGQIEKYAFQIHAILKKKFSKEKFEMTGQVRRQLEIIDFLEWTTTMPVTKLKSFFEESGHETEEIFARSASFRGPENILLKFFYAEEDLFYKTLFETSCSEEFLTAWNKQKQWTASKGFTSEEDIFSSVKLNFIPAPMREKEIVIEQAKKRKFSLITPTDIKAIIHSHSNWSDGSNSIEEMVQECIKRKYEYLVISDHSKTAVYARGLTEEQIREQHIYIDELNKKYKPFRIFKSIESDILTDGSLDYSNNILATFDLVIASVHSNIKMTEEKAMPRLMNAIRNPYTTILGHMTARLLLSRPGFPVDYKKIIDACLENNVVIELNANPRRLELDWRWIDYAIDKGVLISIDPDAHDLDEFDMCRYGVLAAQKGGLTKENNLSSFSLKEFESFLQKRKKLKNLNHNALPTSTLHKAGRG